MDLIVILLFITSLASAQEVFGQDELRADKVSQSEGAGGGAGNQARTIYSQRISPHRMMHFGKRLYIQQHPSIQGYDLYPQQEQAQVEPQVRMPNLFHLRLDRGQTLEALPDVDTARNMVYSFENPQQAFEIGLIEPAQVNTRPSQLANGQRFLKLVNDPTNEANNDNSNLDSDSSIERTQPEVNNGQQQQGPIAVNARSPMQGSRNGLSLPKKFITNMLYGRSSASSLAVPNYGVYNKKAEPKDNFFMHFG